MRFVWDPPKARTNLQKHRVSFEEAISIFADEHVLTIRDDGHSDMEDRWASMGLSDRSRVLVVIHTWPEEDEAGEVVRIISARRANKPEQETYWERRNEEEL